MLKTSKYCRHVSTDRAFVTLDGQRLYLGRYDSPESRDAYDAAILDWRRRHDPTARFSTTIGQLAIVFIRHAETYYVVTDGTQTGEVDNFRYALKPVLQKFRNLSCAQFGPKKLKEVREDLMKRHCRIQVNNHVYRIRQVFRWGVENEMLPGSVLVDLKSVKSLSKGRSAARESEPVQPVPVEHIEMVLEVAPPAIQAMIQLQVLTGARPSEIRTMRVGDVVTDGDVWEYSPLAHKNAWRGKARHIFIGPKGQGILLPFFGNAVRRDQYVFRPREKVNQPYTVAGDITAIRRACKTKQIPIWSPGQLRHNAGTVINRAFGDIDASRVVLGHGEQDTTTIYAERDHEKARDIMRQIG